MSSKFPGADQRALIAALLAAALWTMPVVAQPMDGQAAFDRQEFAQAEGLWRAEAAAGRASAMMGLGLLHDLGLGRPRDPSAALQWYLQAAALGLAEAQFNAGVMLDSGIGLARQPQAAAAWYGRAAANGNVRAQYNLALLFAAGDGVPKNADLARYWMAKAAPQLAAATDRLRDLPPPLPGDRRTGPVVALGGGIVDGHAELTWAAPAAAEGVGFTVQIIGRSGNGDFASTVFSGQTDSSAIRVPLARQPAQMAWRVFRPGDDLGGDDASSRWQVLAGAGPAPQGFLTLAMAPGDQAARRFADALRGVFGRAGYWTGITRDSRPAAATSVSYDDPGDAALARAVAAFLPGLSERNVQRIAGAGPGGVLVWLVGGPAG